MADYIPIFLDFVDAAQELSDAETGRLIKALVTYARGEDWQNQLKGNERFVFRFLTGYIDRHFEHLNSQRERAKSGAQARLSAAERGSSAAERGSANNNNNNNDNNNNNNNENNIGVTGAQSAPTRARSTRFTPPTPDEVRAYCEEHGYGIDAEKFVAYYESNGWRVGRNPMKDWRAAVRTWTRNDNGYQRGGGTDGNGSKPAADDDADLWAGMSEEDIKLVEQLANDGQHWG